MKKVFMCAAITCAVSDYDASLVAEFFKKNGYTLAKKPNEAEIILINTCGSDKYREEKSLDLIKTILRKFSKRKSIVIFGCLVRERNDIFREMSDAALIGPREFHKFNSLIDVKIPIEDVCTNRIVDIKQRSSDPSNYSYRDHCFISISKGCLGECSFCIIKKAKGSLISKPVKKILEEFDSILKMGYKDVVLLADDVGCYGVDIGTDLSALLKEMLKRDGDYNITLHYLEPGWLIKLYPRLRSLFKSNKIACVNVPIQSGNNRILRLMKRHYKIKDVIRVIADIKKTSRIHIATDIVFGFPTETGKEFMDSVRAAIFFDEVIFNIFSERTGTLACELKPKISKEEMRERLKTILKLRSLNPQKYVLSCIGYYNV